MGPINIAWAESKLQHFMVRFRNWQYTNNNYAQILDLRVPQMHGYRACWLLTYMGPRRMFIEPVGYSATTHTAHQITNFSDILKTVYCARIIETETLFRRPKNSINLYLTFSLFLYSGTLTTGGLV